MNYYNPETYRQNSSYIILYNHHNGYYPNTIYTTYFNDGHYNGLEVIKDDI